MTRRIRFGSENVYDQDLSRLLICDGSFGTPQGVHLSPSAECDFAAAVYDLANPADSWIGTTDCAAVAAATGGPVSTATELLCGYLADTFGTGVGLFAAGATLNPGVGVAVWKGVTFFGNTAVCVGLADGAAKAFGEGLESKHEVAVAHDIVREDKCLQLTDQRLLGVRRLNWSAISCPAGFATHDGSPFRSGPPPTVSLAGTIGQLRLASSTTDGVEAALGHPEAEGEGNVGGPGLSGFANYLGLGYECSPQRGPTGPGTPLLQSAGPEGPPYCRTVYYIDAATGLLGGFWTSSRKYATSGGTRVGIAEAAATAREHQQVIVGCGIAIFEFGHGNSLNVDMQGGKDVPAKRPGQPNTIVGGHVSALEIESHADSVGNLFC